MFENVFGWVLGIVSRLLIRAFSPRPVVERNGSLIVVRSTWRTTLLTLGAVSRKVVIDPHSKIVRMSSRIFWAFDRKRVIPFDRIYEVFYTYTDLAANSMISHNEQDLFCVGVKLKDGAVVTFFRFFGEGEFVNESLWPDWMRADDVLLGKIAPHNLGDESSGLADLLCAYFSVPLTNEL
jgi:hypothetical protein